MHGLEKYLNYGHYSSSSSALWDLWYGQCGLKCEYGVTSQDVEFQRVLPFRAFRKPNCNNHRVLALLPTFPKYLCERDILSEILRNHGQALLRGAAKLNAGYQALHPRIGSQKSNFVLELSRYTASTTLRGCPGSAESCGCSR